LQVFEYTIKQYGCPEIINTDQGSQFTSPIFTKVSIDRGIKISMDGKGRALKYEHIYLKPANGGIELYEGLRMYVEFYNTQRLHASINNLTPNNYYYQMKTVG